MQRYLQFITDVYLQLSVSGVLTPIIRNSTTAVAASGFYLRSVVNALTCSNATITFLSGGFSSTPLKSHLFN
jgi:hypothetical protein